MEKDRYAAPDFGRGGWIPGELYALERNARRERAQALGRLLVEGPGRLAAAFARAGSAIADALRGGMRHA